MVSLPFQWQRLIEPDAFFYYQAPKVSLPQAAKQALAVDWFQQSLSVYSIKELEATIWKVAQVNKMQVKEFIQSLIDESLIRVEKIGIGNWYWSFASDAKRSKEKILNDLTAEATKLKATIADLEAQIEHETEQREEDDEMLEDGGMDRKALLEAHELLIKETEAMDKELEGYKDNDPTEVLRKADETKKFKASAEMWTDNIEAIESYLVKQTGDKQQIRQMMEHLCGNEYVIGEGLKEL